jgi:coproporphyrinogen III oxidase-like Fe-S oxidoreductase
LRTKKGICVRDYSTKYSSNILAEKGKSFVELQRRGLVRIEDGFVRPTRAGLVLSDSLALI